MTAYQIVERLLRSVVIAQVFAVDADMPAVVVEINDMKCTDSAAVRVMGCVGHGVCFRVE